MEAVLRFHLLTKHHAHRYAPGPGMLDWANQPNPFREYKNSQRIILEEEKPVGKFQFRDLFSKPTEVIEEMNVKSISKMFQHSLGVSCLKRYANGYMTALRINPSSGNLHPTEAYLVAPQGIVNGNDAAVVAHYNVQHHELEIRKCLTGGGDETGVIYVGFTSIPWRESWKYGERAFRYCQLDMGHALASLEISCKMLGWETRLVSVNCSKMKQALGLPPGEEPECLVEVRRVVTSQQHSLLLNKFGDVNLEPGEANQLSETEIEWPGIVEVLEATTNGTESELSRCCDLPFSPLKDDDTYGKRDLVKLCHQRRSALEYDSTRAMPLHDFLSFLTREIPFQTLTGAGFEPEVHLAIFVHNVQELTPGLYLFVRNEKHQQELKDLVKGAWTQAIPGINLYCLQRGNAQRVAKLLSCNQDIASDSCFSLGMLTRFQPAMHTATPWEYKCLYWECGMLGQHLYLTAELLGARGTGIGCFLDDEMHKILGLESLHYQSLYHFTVGYAVHDSRLVEV